MDDDIGIVYLIENAQQFWSELEDILPLPNAPTLSRLDSTLRRFVSFCATYHEQYLQSSMQLEHACQILLHSELFEFHSERMCELLADDAQTTTDPHTQLILYNICLLRGRQNSNFLRSHKRWQALIPLLLDHILVDIDPEVQDLHSGGPGFNRGLSVPIEAKIRFLAIRLLYEVCRVQKFSFADLRIFQDSFIDHLFDLVEQTRNMQDESFNYSAIKLIVALNEQFMVASLPPTSSNKQRNGQPEAKGENRVLSVLMRRLGSSQTFGENLIFMLNRAGRTPEDLCMQLLVLKILYILFTTKGTSEYFYTNDLCVLVDVFLREVMDLDEDSESLRHTYLRVLHPLLTKTQLQALPYKRPQIVRALESLVANAAIRDINPTTKRLVDRCLGGDWCVQFRKSNPSPYSPIPENPRIQSPGPTTASSNLLIPALPTKTLKSSKSVENVKNVPLSDRDKMVLRKTSNDSTASLPNVAAAVGSRSRSRRDRTGSFNVDPPTQDIALPVRADSMGSLDALPTPTVKTPHLTSVPNTPTVPASLPTASPVSASGRRSAPPAPPKRRKPPAIPTKTGTRATMTTIASTTSSPLAQPSSSRA